MTPEDVLQAIVRALEASGEFTGGDYITHEFDPEGTDNRLQQPIVSFNIPSNPRTTEWDSDLAGYLTDDTGQQQGRIFRPTWEMQIDVAITLAAGNDALDASVLGGEFQQALLPHDSALFSKPFPDGDGGVVEEIEDFTVGNGQRMDDLAGPGLRRWQQELAVTWYHEITTDDPVASEVTIASPSEMSEDDDGRIIWEY